MEEKKIYIASDHRGFILKQELINFLKDQGYEPIDVGNTDFDPKDNYPDFVLPLAKKVAAGDIKGIIIGRSGNGEAIAANKVKGVRAALATSEEMAAKAREHNNANILSLGADYIDKERAKDLVKTFLTTDFSSDERYQKRIDKVNDYELSKKESK
jgi:ribose 5-phosphate isomerase B